MNVLITGATKGIGKAIALNMAKNGHHLALCARNQHDLLQLKEGINLQFPAVKVFIKATNCGVKEEVYSFATDALVHLGQIDVLVNNVGIFNMGFILDEAEDALEKDMKINLYSAYYLYKKLAPLMVKRKNGFIFNMCSVASTTSIVNAGSYCVTKAALLSLNNIMREEMMPHHVKVTAILPGATLTNSWEGSSISSDEFIQPEDVALAIDQIMKMSFGANVDQIVIKPVHGQF
jgi:3-oxoacyl-[acyl-carrier protein] reductase